MNILINVLLAVDMLVALLMTLVILMQRPKSEGLGAAFGGGVTENIFGAQTTNVLVKFTGWLAGIFFVLTFVLSILYAQRSSSDSALHKELMGMPTPAATATTSPAPPAVSPAATTAPNAATSPAAKVSPTATASIVPSPSVAPSASP
jgi:preprotein translocase subunit SecG